MLAGVGFSTADVKLERLPGWEPHSYGYHGDDGMAFKSCGTGDQYGPKWTTGGQVLQELSVMGVASVLVSKGRSPVAQDRTLL